MIPAFSPGGQTLATTRSIGPVRLWNVATQQPIGQNIEVGSSLGVSSVVFSPDGQILATTGQWS